MHEDGKRQKKRAGVTALIGGHTKILTRIITWRQTSSASLAVSRSLTPLEVAQS